MLKILAAFEAYGERAGLANAQRLKAFVLLLRYTHANRRLCEVQRGSTLREPAVPVHTRNGRAGAMCPARFRCVETGCGTEVERTLFLLDLEIEAAQRDWKMAAAA